MKNSIIKKSLAFVLVGAMAFATPIVSSASPITDAYSTDTTDGSDKDTSTSTSTSTSTTTKTGTIEIPEEVEKIQLNVLGITLDKDNVAIDMNEKTTDNLQARVIFDGYDAEDDAAQMDWAKVEKVTLEQKKAIENQIHWYSYDNKVATVTAGDDDKTKAVVTGVADGTTAIVAYIENDGITYLDEKGNAIMRPTDGDFVAYAGVVVTQKADKAELTLTDVYQKHTYDLKEYTNLVYGETSKPLYACTEDVIYSGLKISSKKTAATLKDDGTLKITKGAVGDTITFTMTTSNGAVSTATVTVKQDVPAKSLAFEGGNKGTLDLGSEADKDWYKDLALNVTTADGNPTTDEITWTISDKKGTIAAITDIGPIENNATWATVNAIGEQIGNVKITAKATSGKSASFTLTISATPAKAVISGPSSIYTGQTGALSAVLYGANGLEIPQGKTTFKWSVKVPDTSNKNNAKINSSKGVLTPATLLKTKDGKSIMLEDTVEVSATFSNSLAKIKNKAAENTTTVRIEQSNVKNVALTAQQVSTDGTASVLGTIASSATKADLKGLIVGTSFDVVPEGEGQLESIVWSTTGKGISQEVNGSIPTYTLTASGNKTVKATYYTVDFDKKKATKVTKTFSLKNLVVRAEQLTFDKSAVVVSNFDSKTNATKAGTSVTLKIKAQSPKGAADKITWAVLAADSEKNELTVENKKYDKKTAAANTVYYVASGKNNSTIKITLPEGLKAGSVLKVGAYAEGGAVAYSYIYVTEKTNKVLTQLEKNKTSVKVGDTVKVSPMLEVVNGKEKLNKEPNGVNFTLGSTTTAYTTEPVTYSVDAKSARIVKIDQNGYITGLQKGTAKVTIKTISGKKATVTVTVTE